MLNEAYLTYQRKENTTVLSLKKTKLETEYRETSEERLDRTLLLQKLHREELGT